MMAMPAVMLQKKTSHMSRNRPEKTAWRAVRGTPAGAACFAGPPALFAPPFAALPGAHPSGFQPSGGLRMNAAGPTVNRKNTAPRTRKLLTRLEVQPSRSGASTLLMRRAPSPKPMITIPVARPFLSGNHFATVVTGVT